MVGLAWENSPETAVKVFHSSLNSKVGVLESEASVAMYSCYCYTQGAEVSKDDKNGAPSNL